MKDQNMKNWKKNKRRILSFLSEPRRKITIGKTVLQTKSKAEKKKKKKKELKPNENQKKKVEEEQRDNVGKKGGRGEVSWGGV